MAFSDLFKINKFKEQITKLSQDNQKLVDETSKLKKSLDLQLSVQQMKPLELENLITEKSNKIAELTPKLSNLEIEITKQEQTVEELKAEVGDLEANKEMSGYGLYTPHYEFATSSGYKEKLTEIRDLQKQAIKTRSAVQFDSRWTVNGSLSKGNRMMRNNIKAIFRSFNNECTDAINKVTYSNYERVVKRIEKSFIQHNKMYEVENVQMLPNYLQLKYSELDLAFSYAQKKQEEKDLLREQREKEREDKKLQQEIKQERKKVDKEIQHYDQAIEELQSRMKLESSDKEGLQAEIEKLRHELDSLHDKKSDIDYRESNATAGYVYIISNIGSFGKNIVKIGVTRRLEPLDRINELSSASVPFKFDVHALIFSQDAYALESELHERFADNRVNKVNNRKEYFKIGIEEIEEELKKYQDVTVDFHENPDAEEYRESLSLEQNQENQAN
ncbi:DUF4041 domain-containing protein [Lentilactobacillus otakiensis]|uniref:DUF4041 domain-containing protein n=1 Tax=Lentilactobacillus otakiensis TaxID=481720 RepID=UPI003D16B22D